jgi:hypothetical protein
VALALWVPVSVSVWLDWRMARAESRAPDIGLDVKRGAR